MTGSVYSFIWYPWFVSSFFPYWVMNKKVFPDTRFGRYQKKSKTLDYEKSVRVGEKWLWFSNSASKMGPEFIVRPLFFYPYFCRTVLLNREGVKLCRKRCLMGTKNGYFNLSLLCIAQIVFTQKNCENFARNQKYLKW